MHVRHGPTAPAWSHRVRRQSVAGRLDSFPLFAPAISPPRPRPQLGKTALLRYAASRAGGMTVLSVTGVEAESGLDFAGLHSLVRPVLAVLSQLPEPQREALAAALGLRAAEGADRFLVSAGVLSLLAAAAKERPVVCLIDDAQWLDIPSADALVFTARRIGAEGIVILFAARDGERRRFDAPGLEELVLGGLDHRSALALLDRTVPPLAPAIRERLLVAESSVQRSKGRGAHEPESARAIASFRTSRWPNS